MLVEKGGNLLHIIYGMMGRFSLDWAAKAAALGTRGLSAQESSALDQLPRPGAGGLEAAGASIRGKQG